MHITCHMLCCLVHAQHVLMECLEFAFSVAKQQDAMSCILLSHMKRIACVCCVCVCACAYACLHHQDGGREVAGRHWKFE